LRLHETYSNDFGSFFVHLQADVCNRRTSDKHWLPPHIGFVPIDPGQNWGQLPPVCLAAVTTPL